LNARQLLQTIEARGGSLTVKRDGGAAKIQIAPRGLVGDLAGDIQRFKPALLELLESPDVATIRATSASYWQAHALARVRPELRRQMPGADALELGRLLLRLDAGQDIE
jgi:hypothetical protein